MIQARREAGVIRHYLGASIPFSDMNARLHVRFDHLRADGIIERKRRRLPRQPHRALQQLPPRGTTDPSTDN
ncbi:MAG: hypothetical protein M3Y17_05155 [Actinomycetota bacterium]|nr:hypothetical protein [Actinomycetota bacterium]